MVNFVVTDFESCQEGRIHSMCLIPVRVDGTKFTVRKGVLVYIREVLKNESTQLNTNTQKKVLSDLFDASTHGMEIKHLSFADAVKFLIDYVLQHGSTMVSHNLLSDLDFLVKTQNFVKGKRVVKEYLKEYPKTGMYDKRWESITLVCSMSLITNRAKKFMEDYKNHPSTIPNHNGFYSMKLESFTRFIKDDCLYKQRHTSIQDTIDLVEVLKNVFARDGNKVLVDGNDYLTIPDFCRATS